jgi:hypothetical protein
VNVAHQALATETSDELGKRVTATSWGSSGRRFKSCQPDACQPDALSARRRSEAVFSRVIRASRSALRVGAKIRAHPLDEDFKPYHPDDDKPKVIEPIDPRRPSKRAVIA